MNTLLAAQNISLVKQGKTILSQVSMELHENEVLTIVGPNGAGKTSLLNLIAGLEKPTSGSISRSKKIRFGYMPQQLKLNALLPINVDTFLQLGKKQSHAQKQEQLQSNEFSRLFEELNIHSVLNHSMHDLSGGERQRVLLARAVLQQPNILLLDEPAQGVDINGQNRLYELIGRVKEIHPCAVLMVSHDLHHVMATTDRVICLNQHICCQGSPDNVSDNQAFLDLFGEEKLAALRHYTHHHDHHHDLHGDVISGEHHQGCNHDH